MRESDSRPLDATTADRPIAEASRAIGVSARVLRYWEQLGVVAPSRGPGGRRHFSRHDLLLMALIQDLLESSDTSISELRILRQLAEQEVEDALRGPISRIKLLLQRQAAEPALHRLLEERLGAPRPPAQLGDRMERLGARHPGPGPSDPPAGPGVPPAPAER